MASSFKKTITYDIQANLANAKELESSLSKALSVGELPALKKENLQHSQKVIKSIIEELERYDGLDINIDDKEIERTVEKLFGNLRKEASSVSGQINKIFNMSDDELLKIISKEDLNNFKQIKSLIKQTETGLKDYDKTIAKANKSLKQQKTELEAIREEQSKLNSIDSGKNSSQRKKRTETIRKENDFLNEYEQIAKESPTGRVGTKVAEELKEKYGLVGKTVTEIRKELKNLEKEKALDEQARQFENLEGKAKKAENNIKQFEEDSNEALKARDELLGKLVSKAKDYGINTDDIDFSNTETAIDQLQQHFEDYYVQLERSKVETDELRVANDRAADTMEESKQAVYNLKDAFKDLGIQQKTVDNLAFKIKNLFSIGTAAQIFRRTVRSAVDAIKELDAAMTEQAVVTDFSVSDLWEQMPEYTKQANELGVATKEAYDAATLYYQQGLKTAEVNQLTTNTLRMARIAGLDATTATDRMTNALRGFNMELNETNAQRVADVYSELAAVSATDVNELSVAMTKTASIASSANMEFENTAAFLAQMLETTRESAETAGTALKTVIGRFTEVKKLYTEGELMGSDEEGEAIDVNKVSAALRTAGIDMNKFFVGEVGLDEIFNELAAKWDSLSIVQQRYIATQAAGSRQQSRFIAMLGDYNRLLELQSYAYNADGASQEQYEKTLESLETKLNKLKNAWNNFTMGIANSKVVKTIVDAGTALLNLLNNITTAWGNFDSDGIFSFVTKLGLALGGLAAGAKVTNKSLDILGEVAKAGGLNTDALLGERGVEIKKLFDLLKKEDFSKYIKLDSFKKLEGTLKNIFSIFKKGDIGEVVEDIEEVVVAEEALTATSTATAPALVTVAEGETAVSAASGTLSVGLSSLSTTIPIILAVAAAAYALYNTFNSLKQLTPENQLKALTEATENATQAAQSASSAYDELVADLSTLNTVYSGLDDLVEGTYEWTQQLVNANSQILDIIQKYPELAKFTQILENGQIIIDKTANAQVKEIYQNRKNQQLANQYGLQSQQYAMQIFADNSPIDLATELLNNINLNIDDVYEMMKTGKLSDGIESELISINAKYGTQIELLKKQSENSAMQSVYYTLPSNIQNSKYGQNLARAVTQDSYGFNVNKQIKDSTFLNSYNQGLEIGNLIPNIYNLVAGKRSLSDTTDMLKAKIKTFRNHPIESLLTGLGKNSTNYLAEMVAMQSGYTGADQYEEVTGVKLADQSAESLKKMYSAQGALKEQSRIAIEAYEILNSSDVGQSLMEQNLNDLAKISDEEWNNFEKDGNKAISNLAKTAKTKIDKINNDLQKNYGVALENFGNDYNLTNKYMEWVDTVPSLEQPLQEAALGGNFETIEKAFDIATLSSSIKGYAALKKQLDSTDESINKFANDAINIDLYNLNNQSKELVNTLDEETLISLKDANAVLELAKSNNTLSQFLDNTGMSASAYAEYLQQIASGTIQANKVSDSYLKTLSKLHASTNTIKDSLAFIENFDPGKSSTEVGDKWSEMITSINDLYSKGAYGDTQLQNYIKAYIGTDNWNKALAEFNGDLQKAEEKALGTINNMGNNFYDSWVQFAKKEKKGIAKVTENGSIQLDFTKFADVDSLKQSLQKELQISKDAADAMISQFITYSGDATRAFTQQDTEGAIKYWLEENVHAVESGGVLLDNQLEELSKLLGIRVEEIQKTLEKSTNIKVKKASYDSLRDQISELMGGLDSGKEFDLDQAYEFLISLNIDDENARSIIKDFYEDVNSDFSNVSFKWNNSIYTQTLDGTKNDVGENITEGIDNGILDQRVTAAQEASAIVAKHFYASQIMDGLRIVFQSIADNAQGIDKGLTRWISNGIADWFNSDAVKQAGTYSGSELKVLQNAEGKNKYNADDAYTKALAALYNGNGNYTTAIGFGNDNSRVNDGSDSGANETSWDNKYDWLENLLQEIEVNSREMTQLQADLTDMFEDYDSDATISDMVNNLEQQIQNLAMKQVENQALADNRKAEIDEILQKFPELTDYVKYNDKGYVQINYDEIEKLDLADNELIGGTLDEVISQLQSAADGRNEALETIENIDDEARAIEKELRSKAASTLEKLRQNYVKYIQMQIDAEKAVSDAIKESNNELIDSLNNALEKERQDRQNQETEKDITDKQQRLAYLKLDTSGGHQLEIMQLEKDINDARQDYTDSLIDQKVNELKEQNDEATEQRERQIQLASDSLERANDTGEVATIIKNMLSSCVSEDGKFTGDLKTMLETAQGTQQMTQEEFNEWQLTWTEDMKETLAYIEAVKKGEDFFIVTDDKLASAVELYRTDVQTKLGNIKTSIDTVGSKIEKLKFYEGKQNPTPTVPQTTTNDNPTEASISLSQNKVFTPGTQTTFQEGDTVRALNDTNRYGWTATGTGSSLNQIKFEQQLDNKNYRLTAGTEVEILEVVDNKNKHIYGDAYEKLKWYKVKVNGAEMWFNENQLEGIAGGGHKFATGGLADFTGPAWLDGTKSKPEMVLNATDTENFIALKDILGQFMKSKSQSDSLGSNMVNNFTINVDEISNDYDVDKLVKRVKDDLYEIGAYRNVTRAKRMR